MTDKELGTAAGEIFAKAFTLGYETGREYVPVGGRVLTAELVEDVRALVWLDGRRNFDAFRRLRALFPATEPAADAKPCGSNSVTLGWCKLTARHEGLHTNGTYLWGTPSEPDPPAAAEPAEEETKAEGHDPDALAKRLAWIWHDGWDACGERERGYLRRAAEMAHSYYASSPVVPAPTETGPWQTLAEIPASVTRIMDRGHWIWTRIDADEWRCGAITQPSCLAPFVSAEEKDA